MRLNYSKCNTNHYRQVINNYLKNFDYGNDNIITVLHFTKNYEYVVDHFPCECHGTTTEQQHSMTINLISCIFTTKYVIELKKLTQLTL